MPCDICNNHEANWYCKICKQSYCRECLQDHNQLTDSKHEASVISCNEKRRRFCAVCQDDAFTFCSECKKYLCCKCTENHKLFTFTQNHTLSGFDELTTNGPSNLPDGIDEVALSSSFFKYQRHPSEIESLSTFDRALININCPQSSCSGLESRQWLCFNCKERLQYDISKQRIFCNCGNWENIPAKYRCGSGLHDFIEISNTELHKLLKDLPKVETKNILLLGETGVGKSSWINSIANFATNYTISEAVKNCICLIPTEFTMTDKFGVIKTVTEGEFSDAEMRSDEGQTATQYTRSYVFQAGEINIRFIDTPGIADCRGIDKDKENCENILTFLYRYKIKELHGICILLNPNESRLKHSFIFCIKELFRQLHKSSTANLVFCYTHARSVFFEPGDTQTSAPLLALLRQIETSRNVKIPYNHNNTFYLDNEAFRYLCAMKHGIEIAASKKISLEESWNKSRDQTVSLLEYISTIEPYDIENSICINAARNLIEMLITPMADLHINMHKNINELENAKETIFNLNLQPNRNTNNAPANPDELRISMVDQHAYMNKNINVLENEEETIFNVSLQPNKNNALAIPGQLSIPVLQTKLQVIQLGKTHIACGLCKKVTYTESETKKVSKHFKICEEKPGFWTSLWRIITFQEYCKACQHKKSSHFEVDYKTVEKNYIKRLSNIKELTDAIYGMKVCTTRITEITAYFIQFISRNALVATNDAALAYIVREDTFLNDEEITDENRRDHNARLKSLHQLKINYTEEKNKLERLSRTSDQSSNKEDYNNPEKVYELRDELFAMEHIGDTLREMFNATEKARANAIFRDEIDVNACQKSESGKISRGLAKMFGVFRSAMVVPTEAVIQLKDSVSCEIRTHAMKLY